MMFNHDLRTRIICSLGSFRIQLTFQGTSKIGVNFYKLWITEIRIINNHYHYCSPLSGHYHTVVISAWVIICLSGRSRIDHITLLSEHTSAGPEIKRCVPDDQ